MKYALIVFFIMFSFLSYSQVPQDLTEQDLELFDDESIEITTLIAIINDYKSSPEQYNPGFRFNTVIVDRITVAGFEPPADVAQEIRNYFSNPKLRDQSEQILLSIL